MRELARLFTGVFQHEVMLSSAGLHWLSVTSTGDGRFVVRSAMSAGPIGVLVLENGVALTRP